MTFRQLTPRGVKTLEVLEGKVPYVYDDAVYPTKRYKAGQKVRGTLTAGVGHVGPDLRQWVGKDIPTDQIDRWLDADTDTAEQAIDRLVKVPLADNQWDTLYMWAFNVGISAAAGSTLIKRVNARDFDKVPTELAKWNKTRINGKLVQSPGLVTRRAKEIAYWNEGSVPVKVPDAPDSGTPVAERTPHPTSPLEWAGIAVSGLTGMSGLSGVGGFFGIALGVVLVGGFLIAAAIIIKRQFFSK